MFFWLNFLRKHFFWLLFSVSSLLVVSCTSENKTELHQKKPLVVGMDLTFPPFEMKNEEGIPKGISADLSAEIAKRLGRPLEIKNIAFDGLIPALKTKKIDLIISSMSVTKERKKVVSFSNPYIHYAQALLLKKGGKVHEFKDLDKKGVVVAVRQATVPDFWAKKHLKKATIKRFSMPSDALTFLLSGRADALIYDQISVYEYAKENSQTLSFSLEPLKDSDLPTAIALRKNDHELLKQVNQALIEIKKEKLFEKWAEQYLSEVHLAFKKQGVPFVFR